MTTAAVQAPPRPEDTLVIILGASVYPRKPAWSNPVLGTSAKALFDYFISSNGMSTPARQVLNLFDAVLPAAKQCERVEAFLQEQRHAGDLIVYYIGHGGFDEDEYYLGVRDTAEHREFITAIESRKIARIIRERFGRKRVYVILDACFAASAARDWQASELEVAVKRMSRPLPRRGCAFLAAASKDDVTRAPAGARYTVFTGALLGVLQRGIPHHDKQLSLYDLYEEIRDTLGSQQDLGSARPELHAPRQNEGDISRLPLFPNAAYHTAADHARADHCGVPFIRADTAETTVRREIAKKPDEDTAVDPTDVSPPLTVGDEGTHTIQLDDDEIEIEVEIEIEIDEHDILPMGRDGEPELHDTLPSAFPRELTPPTTRSHPLGRARRRISLLGAFAFTSAVRVFAARAGRGQLRATIVLAAIFAWIVFVGVSAMAMFAMSSSGSPGPEHSRQPLAAGPTVRVLRFAGSGGDDPGEPSIEPSWRGEPIEGVERLQRDAMIACHASMDHDNALRREGAAMTLKVALTIDDGGTVQRVQFLDPVSARLRACLPPKLRSWKLLRPPGGILLVQLRFGPDRS